MKLNNGSIFKILELKILGKNASSYCYNYPSKINVDVTGRCNLNCVWCSRNFVDIPNIDINENKVFELFKWMKNPVTITFAGFGEPLLYDIDMLCRFINVARAKAKNVRIITNGTLLNRDIAYKIGTSKLTNLIVSVDSTNEDIYRKIRGASLKRVKDNILVFTSLYNIPVDINSVAFAGKHDDWSAFKHETGVRNINLKPLKESEFSRANGFEPHPDYVMKKSKCFQPFYEFNLGVDGRMYPCCTCRTLGLNFDYDFDYAWNNTFIRTFRKKLIEKKYIKYCRDWCGLQRYKN